MPPLTLVIPWTMLVPNNEKYGVFKGRMILASKYRSAKHNIYLLALSQRQQQKAPRFDGPVRLSAVVYEPNQSRDRDITNFCKLVHDALEDVAYENDHQINNASWSRGPVDSGNPRIELAISPISDL